MLSYPSKDSPHPQPCRVTTACALLPFPRCAARSSRVCVAARAVHSASRCERRLQGFALGMGPYHPAPFPTKNGLPFHGLLCPLQGPSIPTPPLARDIATNSRAASADLSLFRLSTLQWARPPRPSNRREAERGARSSGVPHHDPLPREWWDKRRIGLLHPKMP